jgi:vancomycin aglycone glucosyltransferase
MTDWGACRKTRVVLQDLGRTQYGRRHRGHDVRVLLSTYRGRGDVGLLVGLAVRLRALGAEVRVCAPPDWSGGRQPEMRTCPARGSTELETPVIRPASAGQRSTAASEVSR